MSDYNIVCMADDMALPARQEFARLVRSRWPNAKLEELAVGSNSLLFVTGEDDVEGRLSADGAGISFAQSRLKNCAEFTVWLRGMLLPKMDLEFFDDELSASVVVGLSTTAEDIVKAFSSAIQ